MDCFDGDCGVDGDVEAQRQDAPVAVEGGLAHVDAVAAVNGNAPT